MHSDVGKGIVHDALLLGNGCISTQVVQEWLNVALCKAQVALTLEAARRYLEVVLAPLVQATANEALWLYHRALDVQARWRLSFYDSMIDARALVSGCKTLLREDLQHGQRLDGLTVVNPFL